MYGEGVIEKLTELLKPFMLFVDVEANIGHYSVIAANIVGRFGCLIQPNNKLTSIGRCKQTLNLAIAHMLLPVVEKNGLQGNSIDYGKLKHKDKL